MQSSIEDRNTILEAFQNAANLMNDGKHDLALKWFRKGLEVEPRSGELLFGAAVCLMDLGKHQEAIETFKEAMEAGKNNKEMIHLHMADIYKRMGNYKESMRNCKEAIRLRPGFVHAFLLMGDLYSEKGSGSISDAEKYYRKALKNDHDNLEALTKLGLYLEKQGKTEEANACYEEVINACPYYPYIRMAWDKLESQE